MSQHVWRGESRGRGDFGWLQARYSFSFASYLDPRRMGFGLLRVLNDDVIAAGAGFGTHPHQDMEIITIPLAGVLQHRDSTGGEGLLRPGEVQVMSAGRGIRHSEHNASDMEPLSLLQIWIETAVPGAPPAYGQRDFPAADRRNRLQLLASPDGAAGSLTIQQRAWISRVELEAGHTLTLRPRAAGNGLFLFLIDGELAAGGEGLGARDAMEVQGPEEILLEARRIADLVVIEVSMV